MDDRQYFVYILTNHSGTLYIGVTNDLPRRLEEHRNDAVPGFTRKYRLKKLVWYEATPDVMSAIEREKQLKGWLRSKKIALIKAVNPTWRDLADDFVA